jgi:hypothetical protein
MWTFHGHLADWYLDGISVYFDNLPDLPPEQVMRAPELTQKVDLVFHYSRRPQYYVTKVIFPLFLLALASLGVYAMDTLDVASRLGYALTALLAAYALLFTISADLPRGDELTSLDKLVILTLIIIAASGLVSVILAKSVVGENSTDDPKEANLANGMAAIIQGSCYVLCLVWYVVAPFLTSFRTGMLMSEERQNPVILPPERPGKPSRTWYYYPTSQCLQDAV